jgi:hypothetical protein
MNPWRWIKQRLCMHRYICAMVSDNGERVVDKCIRCSKIFEPSIFIVEVIGK